MVKPYAPYAHRVSKPRLWISEVPLRRSVPFDSRMIPGGILAAPLRPPQSAPEMSTVGPRPMGPMTYFGLRHERP